MQLTLDEIKDMSAALRETIDEENFKEALGKSTNHSYKQIVSQGRRPAIAARMISRPREFSVFSIDKSGNIVLNGRATYDANRIAQIFIKSVAKNGHAPYPLTGDWSKIQGKVKQLYIFISGKAVARFAIKSIQKSTQIPVHELQKLTDPTPVLNSTFKSYAIITDVETVNLPQDFIGNYSGKSVHSTAFKGSSPLVYIL